LRELAKGKRRMLKKLHTLLLRCVTAACSLPAGLVFQNGKWLKNILKGKLFFSGLLKEYRDVLHFLHTKPRVVQTMIKAPLSVALMLYWTQSFRKALRHIFGVFAGDSAFVDFPGASVRDRKSLGDYIAFITSRNRAEESPEFVPMTTEKHDFSNLDAKCIAFYLPQFHAFPLNDEWFGKGFTEWTNVAKAIPQFTGHYQPQLPIDLGFYDLNDITVMRRQAELAKFYGLYGFCFHYYWFSGTRLMEMPIFKWLKHQEINFPFCLNWANENWSKLWDGGNKEVGYKQELKDGDDERFFADILPFFQDFRYIKVRGKPVFIVYQPHLFERTRCITFTEIMRKLAVENGFPGLFLIAANSHGFQENPAQWGLDAMLEFPPHGMLEHGLLPKHLNCFYNSHFRGQVWDGGDYVSKRRHLYTPDYKLFKGVFPSWDNTPRKAYSNSMVIDGVSPAHYKQWLMDCITYTRTHHDKDEQFIFINAWNEWAEGAHLEPDRRYGYAYLQATRDALLAEGNRNDGGLISSGGNTAGR